MNVVQAQTTIAQESFESANAPAGSASSYGYSSFSSNTFDLRPNSTTEYFVRSQQPVTGFFSSNIGGIDGSWLWACEGVRGTGGVSSTSNPPTRSAGYVQLNSISIAGKSNVQVKVLFANSRGPGSGATGGGAPYLWETDDFVRVKVRVDGGNWTTIGQFTGDNSNPNNNTQGVLRLDANLNNSSVDDEALTTPSPSITSTFQDFTFNVAGTGSTMDVMVEADYAGASEELAFDNIRVLGTQATTAAPVLANIENTSLNYNEGDPATQITGTLTVADTDSPNLTGGSVRITTGLVPAQDRLLFTNQNGITGSYNTSTGVLTLTGTASVAAYQAALRSVQYQNIQTVTAIGGLRLVSFNLTDGSTASNTASRNVIVNAQLNSPAALPYVEDFETDGEGLRYASDTWLNSGSCLGFLRTNQNPYPCTPVTIGNISNSYYWYSEGTSNPANPNPVDIGTLTLAPVNATGYANLRFGIRMATGQSAQWENDDFVKFYYRVNGGAWVLFSAFYGNGTLAAPGELQRDTDLDGVADGGAGSLTLNSTMQTADLALPSTVTGASVDFQILVSSDGQEEFMFDRINITGTQVTTVNSIVRASANPTNMATVNYTVTFGSPVTGLTASNFSLTTSGIAGASVGTPVAGANNTWTVPVNTGTGTGTLTLNLANSTGLSSSISTTLPFTGETYTIDKTAPAVTITSSAGTNGGTTGTTPIPFTITFSEVVSGFALGDLTVTGGTPSGLSGTGTTYTFNVTPTTAGVVTTVNIAASVAQDAAGNGNTAAAQYSITYQQPAVTVTSVTRLTPSPTATAQVSYRVAFSGAVTGLTTGNFNLTTSGLNGATVASLAGSATTYTVTVNTGTGDGDLTLNVANATGVSPTISNVPYTSGDRYTITRSFAAAPTLRIQAAGSNSGNGDVTAFVDVVQVLQSGTSTAVANAVQNASFETNNVDPANFKKAGDGVVASPWLFTGLAGISRNNSAFGSSAAEGDAVGLLQSAGDNNASISQSLAVSTGSYQVRFRAVQRNYTSLDQRLNVFVNNVFVGNIQPNNIPTYDTFTSASFNVTAPALTATVSTNSASPTSTTPIPFAVTFSQSVGSTFTASDITVSGGTLASGSFSGSGGGPYTFTVIPAGIGTVTVSLAANVALDANNTGNSASNSLSVQFQAPTITLAPTTLPDGTQGTAYSQALTTSGGTVPYGYAITGGSLPAGLILNLSTGTISGTPTANGSFNFTVTARDNSPAPGPYSGSQSYTLVINPQPVTTAPVVTAPANGALVNTATPTYTGTAPANSTVTVYVDNTSIGATTANAAGSWALTQPTALSQGDHQVRATAQRSGQAVSPNSNTNTFTVDTVAPTVVLSSNTVANGGTTSTSPILFTATFSEPVTGLTSTGISVSGGSVTSGPTAGSGNTYTFQVTPSGVGTVAVQVLANTVQDRAGNTNTNSSPYTFTFQAPTISLTPALLPNGTVGVAYSLVFTASGGTSPYTYAITAGALPAGMRLAGNGTLSGTPTAGGSFNFTVTATDNAASPGPYSGSRSYTFTINAPTVALLPNTLPNGQQGTAYSVVFTASGGTSPYTYAILAGSLPAGLTLASNGTLSGIPTASGSFNITVTATDASTGAGPYSGSRGYTLTINPQLVTAAPVVTAPANGALVNTATPTYTGTAPANSTVTVYVDDTSIGTTTATGGGTWSLTQPTALSQGDHRVRATAQRSGQAVSASSNTNTFTVDTVAPTVVIASSAGASGSTTGTTPILFSVIFSEPVTGFVATDLTVSGGSVGNFAGSGTSYTFDVTPTADGLITVEVAASVAQDGANSGNTAATPFTITYSRPVTATPVVITPANGSLITATKPTYTGTATASASLTLVVDENIATSQTTTVDGSGNWTLTQLSDLTPGGHTVQARAQLAGQAVSAYSAVNSFTVVVLPGVVTATPTGVSSSGATLGGEVTDAGAGTVSERGVVYVAGNGTPTISDTKVAIGAGTGSFAQAVTNLSPSTTYSVRAYAINQAGTSYGTTQLVSTGNALAIGSVTPEAVCAGGTISVAYTNSSPGTTLVVYLNGPSTSNLLLTTLNASQASGTITASIPADRVAGQYSVYLSGGGASSGSVNLTVKVIPPAPSTMPVTVCQNTTPVSLATGVTASQGASLNWYTAATGGTASANAPVPPTSTVGSTTYYVSQLGNGCESPRVALIYTVNALPVATLTNDGPLSCAKTTVTLTAGEGSNYRFSDGAAQVGTSNQATVSLNATYSVT
ncbi:putative Ig domain-containing protein, partial [Spirosoma oryzae]